MKKTNLPILLGIMLMVVSCSQEADVVEESNLLKEADNISNSKKVTEVADFYNIYLVNRSPSEQNFWCFLQDPEINTSGEVYANSSTHLIIAPNYPGVNYFTIPLQYVIGAGAGNQAVGLDTRIVSSDSRDTEIGDHWGIEYLLHQGPNIVNINKLPEAAIMLTSNPFDKIGFENQGWYSNMSFGIQSSSGYIGMTWSPDPNQTTIIVPKFTFYIATGDFQSNQLADFTTISSSAAEITQNDFGQGFDVTVTLTETGEWVVETGAPNEVIDIPVKP
ncbi:hypothetical protein [Flavivirga jejuensis]|uniref:Uncharacterized protein n=1 Tax=Flavivirga jejuensis TaxID=870487 RepID=A0ABT8WLP8_9FLAO|nr:hypothetical protein [Flavivirga jejuensis]MDO5974070.1 hypothetical protein [Flavivirga jejuensis]